MDLYNWLLNLAVKFTNDPNFRPATIESSAGTHGCTYDDDEDGDPYVTIGFNLPNGVHAEIEDGTYGELQGFRIYLKGS